MQSQASGHADRVAAALVMSSGPFDEQDQEIIAQQNEVSAGVAPSLSDHSGLQHSGMTRIEDARSKFMGGFTSLKSEISQLKQTMMND